MPDHVPHVVPEGIPHAHVVSQRIPHAYIIPYFVLNSTAATTTN